MNLRLSTPLSVHDGFMKAMWSMADTVSHPQSWKQARIFKYQTFLQWSGGESSHPRTLAHWLFVFQILMLFKYLLNKQGTECLTPTMRPKT